jgi:hypothetical protein
MNLFSSEPVRTSQRISLLVLDGDFLNLKL